MRSMLLLSLLATLAACATVGNDVVRDRSTYTAEVFATLQRQQLAAKELKAAALAAKAAKDYPLCARYAHPTLVIEAKAQAQAYRALWLASVPYPKADGSLPAEGEEQADPGPAPKPEPVATVCGEQPSHADEPKTPEGGDDA